MDIHTESAGIMRKGKTMRINHNIAALNALNRSNVNNEKIASNFQRISSGLRINRASDDAAGLSISEKMKALIRGLGQAQSNIEDGKSLVSVAESALGLIMNPNLQRMRELIIQGMNGTYTQEDREKMQTEIDQIKQGIDEIANNTEFNTTKVIRPPLVDEDSKPSGGVADIVFVVDVSGSMGKYQQTVAGNLQKFIGSIESKGVTDIRMGLLTYGNDNYTIEKFNGDKWCIKFEDLNEVLNNLKNEAWEENGMTAMQLVADKYDFRENADAASKHIIILTNEAGDDNYKYDDTLDILKSKGMQVHGVYNTDPSSSDYSIFYNNLIDETGGKSVDISDVDWGNQLSSVIGEHIGSESSVEIDEDKMPTLHLQVGPAEGHTFEVELMDARVSKLGIEDVCIDPIENAEESLKKIDEAMAKVSSKRSEFGAYYNALEHIGNNVGNYQINLTNAQSIIESAGIAKEIADLEKNKVLLQASQSMIARSNEVVKGVLELLK